MNRMEGLSYKTFRTVASLDAMVEHSSNIEICRAAFEQHLFVWPTERLR
jgi:hypothetical protein